MTKESSLVLGSVIVLRVSFGADTGTAREKVRLAFFHRDETSATRTSRTKENRVLTMR